MRPIFFASLLLGIVHLVSSCSGGKAAAASGAPAPDIAGKRWELQYITGPRIAFAALYPERKPSLTFDKSTGQVQRDDSCNGYTSGYTLDGDKIAFGEPGPSTLMYCGQGEQVFRTTLEKVKRVSLDADGKLVMYGDDVALMRFRAS